ncbi:hypothetical protein [Anaplasma phagocytophilum]|uniref:hypothetical protein n=1 Tax=Anaplasma phagocytophilum TaxID=948 RepID=UPI00035B9E24|nr:hypothetical protein [Anaplasma phagocytophilum]AGR80528.1 hypothetical protein WSQ_01745 [Anaplasma phagocytophilum str. JM]AGR81786.1 hypothetical protein YYY_01760 [Anaplasma phagocytophilum str. Dog2]PLC10159.1 hypothetical protein C0V68_02620 [Anaplasma phagocytophilum]
MSCCISCVFAALSPDSQIGISVICCLAVYVKLDQYMRGLRVDVEQVKHFGVTNVWRDRLFVNFLLKKEKLAR